MDHTSRSSVASFSLIGESQDSAVRECGRVEGLGFEVAGQRGEVSPAFLWRCFVAVGNPDPWENLESRSPLRVPRNYPVVV